MKMAQYRKEVTLALDECLDRILAKGESTEQCLQRYPALAGELAPLLKTALLTQRAAALAPRPEFRERARFQFQATLRDMAVKKEKRRGFSLSWQPKFATIAITIVLAVAVLGSGTVAAASNSLPDSPLYPVKLATETIQLKLADTPLDKAGLYAKFADNRVAELVKMAEKGKTDQVEKLASRLNSDLMAMTIAAKANGQPEMTAAGEVSPMLRSPTAAAPAPGIVAEPGPGSEPETTPTREPSAVTPKPAPAPVGPKTVDKAPAAIESAPVAAVPQPLNPGQIAKLEKRAQLKTIVRQKADTNPQAIRDALKNAPDSVKAALYQALMVADNGYQQALDALGN
jgi:hypothetical protein